MIKVIHFIQFVHFIKTNRINVDVAVYIFLGYKKKYLNNFRYVFITILNIKNKCKN